MQTGNSSFDSSKISYYSADPVRGINLEILKTKDNLHFYLDVSSRSIPPYKNNLKEAIVEIEVEGQKYIFIASRHSGGQRVLLPTQAQELIVSSLQGDKSVQIALSGYKTTLLSDGFAERYEKLQTSPFKNPFKLPF
jgi:hypothetical protein